MSLLNQASLIQIPSGYKEGTLYSAKPINGDGDLDFTRSNDTATRVNSVGLIEKVRTNRLLQSNTFSTTWLFVGTGTVTTGATDPFGGTTAWTLAKTAANTFLYQSTAGFSGSATFSIYAKAGTVDQVWINHAQSGAFSAFFDLTLGTTFGSAGCVATIVSVGGGWFRCSISGTVTSPINMRIYPASGGSLSGTTGNILIYAAQGETGNIATDYIPTTSAAVSVGMTANVPRLDYTGGGCPKLLLEPQRTNVVTYSEQIDNAAWIKTNVTISANATISPDGYQNADKLTLSSGSATKRIALGSMPNTAVARSYSFFVKSDDITAVQLVHSGDGEGYARFDISTGVVGSTGTKTTSDIQDYGNGWYRCIANFDSSNNFGSTIYLYINDSATGSYGGTTSAEGDLFVYGAQYEEGSYPTSYINTLSAASTRGEDACFKTGISSLIGQSEGVVYVEYDQKLINQSITRRIFALSDGTTSNRITAYINSANGIDFYVRNSGGDLFLDQASSPIGNTKGVHKIAAAYKNGDYAVYLDGVEIISGAGTAGTIPACSRFDLGQQIFASDLYEPMMQSLLFPTRLTNDELADLTTL